MTNPTRGAGRALLCAALLVSTSVPPAYAAQAGGKLSRTDLMSLAKQFVDRVGGKLDQIGVPPPPPENIYDRYEDGETFYFQIRLPKRIDLERQVTSIKQDHDVFISLADFVTAADFAIGVNAADQKAQGWYIRENNPFVLDIATHTVNAGGKTFEIASDDILINNNDIYVRSQALATWLDFKLSVNLVSQKFEIEPSQKWPIQERYERNRDKNFKRNFRKPPSLPLQDDPYDMVSLPNADLTVKNSYIHPKEGQTDFITSYTSQIAGDIAGHTAKFRVTGDDEDKISDVSMSLYKESNKPDLLGPLQARRYEIGDISPVNTPLINSGGHEIGAQVSNKDPYVTYDTSVQITGDATPGWDVELFRDDQYLATVSVDDNGVYAFNDIPLFAKENNFRIVQYGPQGEIREEIKTYRVDPTLYESGKGLYDVSVGIQDSQIYSVEESPDEDKGTPHLAANYERQLTNNMAARTGVQIREENGEQKAYAQAGLVGTYDNTIINADTAIENGGAYAAKLTGRQRLGDQNIIGSAQYFSENFSPGSGNPRPAEFILDGTVNGTLPFKGVRSNYTANSQYRSNNDGMTTTENSLALSANMGRLTLGNTITHTTESDDDVNLSRTDDTLSVRGKALGLLWRSTADYEIQPNAGIEGYDLELTKVINRDLRGRLEFEHDLEPDSYTKTELSVDWQGEHALVTPSIAYDSDKTITAMLNVKTGLTKNPYTGEIKISDETLSDKGGVAALVFLDKDGDNLFSDGDELLQDVRVKALHANKNADTDEKGEAFIYNIPDNRVTDVFIDEQSFTDPYWVAGFAGVSIRPRAGHVSRIEFPIHMSGEIDGTAYAGSEPLANIGLNLFDNNGKIQQTAVTDAGGFYWMTKIPPGDYTLMVDSNDARNKGAQMPLPVPIHIGYEGTILNGKNISLENSENPVGLAMVKDISRFAIDDPALDLEKPLDGRLVLNLGTYNSNMLMTLTWYKMRTFHSAWLGNASALVPPTESLPNAKTGKHTLRAVLPTGTKIENAYNFCRGLSERGYECTVEIIPTKPAEQVVLGMNDVKAP